MKLEVHNINGEALGREVELPADIFGIEPNEHVVYLAVKQYLANKRQGTHKAKERNEVKGSTRKIKRQKGTGTARAGDIKNPLFRGGGRIFGPQPRNYTQRMNKKVKVLARKSVLAAKAQSQAILVVEDFSLETPSTKSYIQMLEKLEIGGKKLIDTKSLLLLGARDENLYLSSRNLSKANVTTAELFNVYEVMNAEYIILSESAVNSIKERFVPA